MDNTGVNRLSVWPLPLWALSVIAALLFWRPFFDAIHYGQVSLLLTGILAAGLGRSLFIKGVCVGFCCAIKPTCATLVVPLLLLGGRQSFYGLCLGVLPILVYPFLLEEYITIIPDLIRNGKIGGTLLHNYLGKDALLTLSVLSASAIAWRSVNKEDGYMAIIGLCVIGGATWNHAFTPAVLPFVYFANKLIVRE